MEPIRRDMELLSNSMATYAHIKANPESFALYFMMGVCFGLFSALCLLVSGITCRRRLHRKPPPPLDRRQLKESSAEEEEVEVEEEEASEESAPEADSGTMTTIAAPKLASVQVAGGSNGTLDVFASAEELEKARRLEERERILREIWRNGQPDILVTGTGTIGRVHYH